MKQYIKRIAVVFVLSLICMAGAFGKTAYANATDTSDTDSELQEEIADKVLRFHIRANSDTDQDQAIKLKVRDKVAEYLQDKLKDVDTKDEAIEVVQEHMDDIISVAKKELEAEGEDLDVTASITTDYFPEKTYGIYTFPAGNYEALIVSLGAAKGHNWWCVMYPNLCFVDGVYEEPEEESEKLKDDLTEDEYNSLLDNNGSCRIRFKYLTFLNQFVEQ